MTGNWEFPSRQQRAAVDHERDMILLACPGSGKTRTVAARVARLVRQGTAIAACSYTNVGVDAVRQALRADHSMNVDTQHFVGTLHTLLLRHVTYPFGHLVCGATPRLLHDESPRWPDVNVSGSDNTRRTLKVSNFRMRPDGSIRVSNVPYNVGLSPEVVLSRGATQARELKGQMARDGWISFDDAMYIALRVLRAHSEITSAVAARYEEILVDEAQDTSELQLACLRELVDSGGLASLVLVGDVEQAISAYTGASPTGCTNLAAARGLAVVELTENYRCSQKICDVAAKFCSRPRPDTAVGPDAAHSIPPEFFVYPANQPKTAVARFHERLLELGEDPQRAALLARSNGLCDELNGEQTPLAVSKRSLALGRAVAALRHDGAVSRSDIEVVDRIVSLAAFGEEESTSTGTVGHADLRAASGALLRDAPSLNTDLRDWIQRAAQVLTRVSRTLADTPAKSGGLILRSAASHSNYRADDIFRQQPTSLRAQTIHDIKGESRDSVLVVVDRTRGQRQPAALWTRQLRGEAIDPEDAEELRIAFVAITRARRYCLVALPDDCNSEAIEAFETAGFVRLESQ